MRVQEGLFCWLTDHVLDWLNALDHGRLAGGPGGEERPTAYRRMRQAHGELRWSTVVADVRRRDYRSQAARQVYVKFDASAKYGFDLRQYFGSFDCKPDTSWVMPAGSNIAARGLPAGGRDGRRKKRASFRSASSQVGGI